MAPKAFSPITAAPLDVLENEFQAANPPTNPLYPPSLSEDTRRLSLAEIKSKTILLLLLVLLLLPPLPVKR
ncbi:hypothetical protein AND_009769 [Anopheles darlingi]|uniref:Uncharacterized protein n=1 Tax=Anopheles darlingi TaxID=43151 RepID=W5J309_ANODA|nr:hypothetical protein AND_009769 [Anopheles darlingi]